MRFTWDPAKAEINYKVHRVTFEEARLVFFDDNAVEVLDDVSDPFEPRHVALGMGGQARLLVVVYTLRSGGNDIHIISARKPEPHEAAEYQVNDGEGY